MGDSRFGARVLWTVVIGVVSLVVAVLAIGLVSRVMEPPISTARTANPGELMGQIIQVQVLNAGGVPGAARTMTSFLRNQGFDVVESGDRRPFDVEQTYVVDRLGNREAALRVAHVLGLGEEAVDEQIDSRFFVDVTVVIGRDIDQLTPLMDSSSRK